MSDTSPTYLVTGATGFLGRHLIEAIRRDEPHATIVSLLRKPSAAKRPELEYLAGTVIMEGSPDDPAQWSDNPALSGLSGIYHLAAEVKHSRRDSESMTRFNVDATLAMVRVAADTGCRLVFISTSGTIGCSTSPEASPDENAPHCESLVRDWPYYRSKIIAEKRARELAAGLGVELVIMRPPVLLGPGDHRFRSIGTLKRVLDGKLPVAFHGGFHFVDVRDAADAMVQAMRINSPRASYNLPGTASSLDDFFREVARIAEIRAQWRVIPTWLGRYLAKVNDAAGRPVSVLPDQVVIEMAGHYWGLSSKYAQRDLGFRSRDPSLTIADTVAWIRKEASRPPEIGQVPPAAQDHTFIAPSAELRSRQSRG